MAISIEAAAWCYANKNAFQDGPRVRALTNAQDLTMGVKSCSDSCRCGDFVEAFGVFDYYRIWMVTSLLEEAGIVWFSSDWPHNPARADGLRPQLSFKSEYGGRAARNIVDVAGAVENGVQVTEDFVRNYLVDDATGCFTHPSPMPLQQELQTFAGSKRAPIPPTLPTNGYQCLNWNSMQPALPIFNQKPLYYVIYEGFKADVVANRNLRLSAETGAGFLEVKFGDDIKTTLANRAAVYAVTPLKVSMKRKGTHAPTEDIAPVA
jgi:hypothetical protein